MDIHATQVEMKELLKNIQHPRLGAVLGMYEEVGELAKAVMNWEMYGERDVQNLQEECADIFFSLIDIVNAYGVNLDEACVAKLENTKSKISKWEGKYGARLSKLRTILDHRE
jgi:NTP pyrophosphatase (non-canonical NTP hydrolase)